MHISKFCLQFLSCEVVLFIQIELNFSNVIKVHRGGKDGGGGLAVAHGFA